MAQTTGTYAITGHGIAGFAVITCYGSHADTLRKGWRSIGCTSVRLADLDANVRALRKSGYTEEKRPSCDMTPRAIAKATGAA